MSPGTTGADVAAAATTTGEPVDSSFFVDVLADAQVAPPMPTLRNRPTVRSAPAPTRTALAGDRPAQCTAPGTTADLPPKSLGGSTSPPARPPMDAISKDGARVVLEFDGFVAMVEETLQTRGFSIASNVAKVSSSLLTIPWGGMGSASPAPYPATYSCPFDAWPR